MPQKPPFIFDFDAQLCSKAQRKLNYLNGLKSFITQEQFYKYSFFRKIRRALFSCYLCFEICLFALYHRRNQF